jgi:two-component system, NtrC family, response regulator AtoC
VISILIVDDEQRMANGLKTKLSQEGYEAMAVYTGKQALAVSKAQSFDVCILDVRLPDIDGVDLLGKLKSLQPSMEIVMLTGFASLDTAIESMKLGANDYLTKPYKFSRLQSVITKAYEKKSLLEKNTILQEQLHRIDTSNRFIGESYAIKQVMKQVELVAHSDVPALVLGETGTGKELIARAIHEMSDRSANPFVAINSSALQENILESELFGYKRGAFTGAQTDKMGLLQMANKGTFFVDEVGDMNPSIQAKLLRVLETGSFRRLGDTRELHVDVRFVCATNKSLDVEVEEKRFRTDLLYRLNTFTIILPPLRDRGEDIVRLSDYFLKKFARGKTIKHISPSAMKLLTAYQWPGNVRELANVLERAILLSSQRNEITVDDLPQGMAYSTSHSKSKPSSLNFPEEIVSLEEMEKRYIHHVINLVGNNKVKAAQLLGVSRTKLYNKIG